jgi:type IV pilus assembly protein PilW
VNAARGFNLVEVLVALAIGSLVLTGCLAVLSLSRDRFATGESIARLHDGARHALSVLVPDIEAAGMFGYGRDPESIAFVRGSAPEIVLAAGQALRQGSSASPAVPVAGLPAGAHDCGVNFAVDVFVAVEMNAHLDCEPAAAAGGRRAGSDSLTLRHAGALEAPRAGRVQLHSARFASQTRQRLFADGRAPGPVDANAEVRAFDVHTYYIANDSVGRPGWPALRLKSLTEASSQARFRDEEILPGVEDLQVELGVDTGSEGSPRVQFFAAREQLPPAAPVIAVRLWLRLRSETTEPGLSDSRALAYSDANFLPSESESKQRRLLISRTIALRGASP